MDLRTLPMLPTINLSGQTAKPGSSSWASACSNVRRALEEYGCFVAVYDKVSSELQSAVFDALEDLFSLPTETKAKNTSNKPFYGYQSPHPIFPLIEGMGIEDAPILERTQSFTNLMWPTGNKRFCDSIHLYSELVSELERLVKGMVFESYGLEKYLNAHINSTTYLLRFNKYRAPRKTETNLGAFPHSDKSFLTILRQNQVNGLEIQTKEGDWIKYEPPAQSFLVMAGEAFLAWSNNRIHAPIHRVIMTEKTARYSIVLFAFSNDLVITPEELVDDEHPLRFKPFDHFGFLCFYSKDTQKTDCTIKAYCGL
ncbi:hypothetical protein Nepgr_005558 [Nepenthes gracilis]|uniref:Fe2OG dioxygenase domain-containing protein n=1 Tax=Nepenthes gracilis TaxID=150966 RepID=A0AAD3XGG5_NEPGR|nr:hypothetical protein Nepgr_005558 [Nepenthes gracilis]